MAVQRNRRTPSKCGMRRAHNRLKIPNFSIDRVTGETHLRHQLTPDGYYRGRRVIASKNDE